MSESQKATVDPEYALLLAIFGGQEGLKERIKEVLATLTYREREIIKLRYGLGNGYTYTLAETGTVFKVGPERIRQIQAKALQKLRFPRHLNLLARLLLKPPRAPLPDEEADPLSQPISTDALSVRTKNCLLRLNIQTYKDLTAKSVDDLLGTRQFGTISLQEVERHLEGLGLKLRGR